MSKESMPQELCVLPYEKDSKRQNIRYHIRKLFQSPKPMGVGIGKLLRHRNEVPDKRCEYPHGGLRLKFYFGVALGETLLRHRDNLSSTL